MKKIIASIAFASLVVATNCQSVEDLQKHYSGKIEWNASESKVTFKTSGNINFTPKDAYFNYFWDVPKEVKNIYIEANTTVTGAIHTYSDCVIEGSDRKTSVIFGTNDTSWADTRGLKAFKYSHILNHSGTLYVKNLTMLNPLSYFVRGFRQLTHLQSCDFIDNRGGHHNHSDGFAGGDGSTVDNCYFESGDDAIKVYNDITVTNTTFKMVHNCVPIQLGWGDYPDGAVGTFKNITIIGNKGRISSDNAIICGRKGNYTVTINIDGCKIENPNAVMVSLWEEGMTLKGEIKNADIKVGRYSRRHTKGKNKLTICGTKEQKREYSCGAK